VRYRLALALLFFPALPALAEPLRLRAWIENGDLRVEADAPLPATAFIRVQVFREVATLAAHDPVPLADVRVPFSSPDRLEALLPMGDALIVPGHYRVRGEFERGGQYPEVLQAIGSLSLVPVEVPLVVGMDSEAFLSKLLKEQAFLEEALGRVGDFLVRLEVLKAGAEAAPETGIPAWKAWREQERPFLETLILRGREEATRCYPETYRAFAEGFVFHGIFQTESQQFLNVELQPGKPATAANPLALLHAGTGKPVPATGPLKGSDGMAPDPLAPCRALFLRETLHYRLSGADALIQAIRAERNAQQRVANLARWLHRKVLWDRLLDLMGRGLEPLPQRREFAVLLKAVRAWVDAEDRALFEQGPSAKAAEQAVQEALVPLHKALQDAAKPTRP
jgi:hypothetical protein